MLNDDRGQEEITDVYSRAKHLGWLTGSSLIRPFICCVSLLESAPQSLPASLVTTNKAKLTTRDKLPKGQKTFRQNSLAVCSLHCRTSIFRESVTSLYSPLSASLEFKEGLKCCVSAFITSDRTGYNRMRVIMSSLTDYI